MKRFDGFDNLIDIMKHIMSKKLAIVTVIFKNYTILDDYFASLEKQTDTDFHVYAVDLTPEPKQYTYPSYVTYMHDRNGGYAFGINQGIKRAIEAGHTQFCAMNCDVTMNESFVTNVKKSITTHPSSLIGGKIYYYKGFEYHKERYSDTERGRVFWYAGGVTDWANVYTTHTAVDEVDKGQRDTFEETTFITGCLMCYDKTVIDQIGHWDESYFLYYEDADYCARATRAGLKLYYDPSLVIWHKSGQSTEGAASVFQQKYLENNRFIFGMKYAPLRTKFHLLKNRLWAFLLKK